MLVRDISEAGITLQSGCYNTRPRGQAGKIAAIVLHHTGGTDSRLWLSGGHSVSIHKLFSKDGTIWKIVPERFRAWHAGQSEWAGRSDFNDFSLGYEIENLGDGRDPYTYEQYESVASSIAYDCSAYHIPDFWVVDHKTIALPRGRKTDPDPTFDHDLLWHLVSQVRKVWPYQIPLWECAD
jgi:N-acetylmuramoyl-L-alanine amidase